MSDREYAAEKAAWHKQQGRVLDEMVVQLFRQPTNEESVCAAIGFCGGYQAREAESAGRIDAIRYAVREVRTAMNARYGGHVISERMARLEALIEDALAGRGAGGSDV